MYNTANALFYVSTTNKFSTRYIIDANIYFTDNLTEIITHIVEKAKESMPIRFELALIHILESSDVKDIKLSVSKDGSVSTIGVGIFLVSDVVYPSIEFTFWYVASHLIFPSLDGILNSIALMNEA